MAASPPPDAPATRTPARAPVLSPPHFALGRYHLMHQILNLTRDQLNNQHQGQLEWVVIVLVLMEVVVAVLQVLGLLGVIRGPRLSWAGGTK